MDKPCERAGKKKTLEPESDSNTNCNWCARYSHQRIGSGIGGHGNKRMSCDHLNNGVFEIRQNAKKSLVDLRRLALIQLPLQNHQLV